MFLPFIVNEARSLNKMPFGIKICGHFEFRESGTNVEPKENRQTNYVD
jgi:hypothetical protein